MLILEKETPWKKLLTTNVEFSEQIERKSDNVDVEVFD